MDTINNVASAAAKAVWGDDGKDKEPVSGVQGDVSKGEPYDAGNMEAEDQKKVESNMSEDKSTGADPVADPVTETVTGDDTQGHTKHDTLATEDDTAAGKEETPSNPAEEAVEVTGAGPKPLAEIAKEHGGDAAARAPPGGDSAPADTSKDDEDNSESKGTGEEYVKTSGLAADGGDFDATKPGAAREADRLMGEKGMHPNEGKGAAGGKGDSSSTPKKDKPSLGDRIKAKLHKN